MSGVPCAAKTKLGEPCRASAISGSDYCLTHSRSPEEQREHMRLMGQRRQMQRRAEKDASEDHAWVAEGVTKADILKVCVQGLKATWDVPGADFDQTPDLGMRLAAAATLLSVFGRSLRMTPQDAKALLRDVLEGTGHEDIAKHDVADMYHSLREQWFESCARFDEVRGLYAAQVPSFMLGPGETRVEVMKDEAPDFSAWQVDPAVRSETHVAAITPEGEEVFVPRESPWSLDDD